MDNPDTQKT